MKNLRNILFCLPLLFSFAACVKEEPVSVEFKSHDYTLNVGETLDLAKEVVVSNSEKTPVFTSTVDSVAVVGADGLLKALAEGETTVRAALDGLEAFCTVTVSQVNLDSLFIQAPEFMPADGSSVSIRAEVKPSGYNMENLEWTFTPDVEGLALASEKVSVSEYSLKVTSFVEGASVTVKVADRNSGISQTAVITVLKNMTAADRITLTMPQRLTEGEDLHAAIIAKVEPAGYDPANLTWEFRPSSEELKFRAAKVSGSEYDFSFTSYIYNGKVEVIVTDRFSGAFAKGEVTVLERPADGVAEISVSPETLSLFTDTAEQQALKVSCRPENYDPYLLTWSSTDEKVVTVRDGVVTVVGKGTAEVKVKDIISGKEGVCFVSVKEPVYEADVKSIVIRTRLELRVGEENVQLTATCYDESGNKIENYAGLVWKSDDESVASVSQDGLVVPKSYGNVLVSVSDVKNGAIRAVCQVHVKAAEVKVEEIILIPEVKTILHGDSFDIKAIIKPDDAENKTITYKSQNEAVATVDDNGKVTGLTPGRAFITATASNGKEGACEVIVVADRWLELNSHAMTLVVGAESSLSANICPEGTVAAGLAWSSSDSGVASVDGNGKVKAVAAGEVVITAKTSDGISAECRITVTDEPMDFEVSIIAEEQESLLRNGLQQDKTVRLYATYKNIADGRPYYPATKEWRSSDESIATVDADGNVTAVIQHIDQKGIDNGKKVTIRHYVDGTEAKFELTVVKALPERVILTDVPETMLHGETCVFQAMVYPEKADQSVWFAGGGYLKLNNNTYTAEEVGTMEFIAYAADNTGAKCNFTVEVLPIEVVSFEINGSGEIVLEVGDEVFLDYTISPSNASYQTVSWTSSTEGIVSVGANGLVTALSSGSTVITGTLPEGMTVTYQVTVEDSGNSVKVGDYYYSDGTISSELIDGKTVAGVIFSTRNPLLQDSGLPASCVNGLAVALEEEAMLWQDSATSVGTWLKDNGVYSNIANMNVACGYSNTMALTEYNEANPDTKVLIVGHEPETVLPAETSSWFVPSYAELGVLQQNLVAVNAGLEAAGGAKVDDKWAGESANDGYYWSSTENENGSSEARAVHMSQYATGATNKIKTTKTYKVRYIFAF